MEDLPEEKQCTKCFAFKPLTEFSQNKTKKFGRESQCKQCLKERNRKYREDNLEKLREKDRKYYDANREKLREKNRKYYDAKRKTTATQAVFRAQDPKTLARIAERLAKLEKKQNKEKND